MCDSSRELELGGKFTLNEMAPRSCKGDSNTVTGWASPQQGQPLQPYAFSLGEQACLLMAAEGKRPLVSGWQGVCRRSC